MGARLPQSSDQVMGWTTGVKFTARTKMEFFSLKHNVQSGSGAHPASYPMGTRSSYPMDKIVAA
jgi:hypothetical protein